MREQPRSLEEFVNMPPQAELKTEGGELAKPTQAEEGIPETIEKKPEKGVLVRIGETLREYAPAVITGAAAGALFEGAKYYSGLFDNRIIQFLTESPVLRTIFEHPLTGDASDKALWIAIGAGLGALAGGVYKGMKESGINNFE